MSDKRGLPHIPWHNFGMRKYAGGIRHNIACAEIVLQKAKLLACECERLEKEEMAALIHFEPFGGPN